MAKRKSLDTSDPQDKEDKTPAKPPSKPSKKPKFEEEQDELEGSGDESPRTTKKPKYTVKAEETDPEQLVQCSPEGEKFLVLGKNKRATVRNFKGSTLLDIREFYEDKDTKELKPGKKGISLSLDQWEELKKSAETLDLLIAEVKK
ncbi:transcriptional Coactivator p15-domain-containing protein [Mycena galericulata]|nr:transcriptional Coactivator p15-domain-containing protein [Mycena galericulata]